MSEPSRADTFLLEQIRRGEADGWAQLVKRYQGRQLAFAQSRLPNAADAEDLVQETFMAFLRSLGSFRAEASIETFLFTILRHKIIDHLRGRRWNTCLIQDTLGRLAGDREATADLAGPEFVCLGSDMDGGTYTPMGFHDASDWPQVTQALLDVGFGDDEIRGILGENFLRFFERAGPISSRCGESPSERAVGSLPGQR